MSELLREKSTAFLNFRGSAAYPFTQLIDVLCFIYVSILGIYVNDQSGSSSYASELIYLIIPIGLAFINPITFLVPVCVAFSAYILFARLSINALPADIPRSISEGRAMIMFITCICILAVDFPAVFPRTLAKSELFGYSLMDIGVGGITFVSAVNARISLAESNLPVRTYRAVVRSSPSLILAATRLLSVRAADYYVSSSEYGVHWNFFLTAFAVSILMSVTPNNTSFVTDAVMAVAVSSVQQVLISFHHSIEWWFFYGDRAVSLWAANKEGIFSCLGYFSIHLLGRATKKYLNGSKSIVTVAALAWLICGCFHYFGIRSCRRQANVVYVYFTVALTQSFIAISCYLAQLLPSKRSPSALARGINKQPLVYFLVANLLTGVVNQNVNTLNCSHISATIVLGIYVLALWLTALAFDVFLPKLNTK